MASTKKTGWVALTAAVLAMPMVMTGCKDNTSKSKVETTRTTETPDAKTKTTTTTETKTEVDKK